jgi:protease II
MCITVTLIINCCSSNYEPDIVSLPANEEFDKNIKTPAIPECKYSYVAHDKTIYDSFFWISREENKNKILKLIENENQYSDRVMRNQKNLTAAIFKELKNRQNLNCGYVKKYYKIEKSFATTKKSLKIPLTMVYRRDLFKKDGSNPMYLVAYGAYGIEKKLVFKPYRLTLLDRGFIYAIAHVRGGGKNGKSWHEEGRLFKKKIHLKIL